MRNVSSAMRNFSSGMQSLLCLSFRGAKLAAGERSDEESVFSFVERETSFHGIRVVG